VTVDENACAVLGIDPKEVARLARRLERIGKDAQRLGLTVFGASGSGCLVAEAPTQLQSRNGEMNLMEVASVLGRGFDGGDPNFVEVPEVN